MMPAVATALARAAESRLPWADHAHRLLRRLLAALDRLVPPRRDARDGAPPPEWFKYPPI
jgi:hypothetical protein